MIRSRLKVRVHVGAGPFSLKSEFRLGIFTTLILNGWLPSEWITVGTFTSISFPPKWEAIDVAESPGVAIETGTKVLPVVRIWLPLPRIPPFMIWKVFSASLKTMFSPFVGWYGVSNWFYLVGAFYLGVSVNQKACYDQFETQPEWWFSGWWNLVVDLKTVPGWQHKFVG